MESGCKTLAKFSAQHYNAIAKDIREEFPIDLTPHEPAYHRMRQDNMERRTALVNLALRLAKRFEADNKRFEPLKFLDACSPDPAMYPLSELWQQD